MISNQECEEWKDVPGFGDHYMASSLGRIMSKARIVHKRHSSGVMMHQSYQASVLSPSTDSEGYMRVHISVDGMKHTVSVHKMVLLAFDGPPASSDLEACHNDNNPSNNRPGNLRWDTHLENNRDRHRAGHYATGRDHAMAKFTTDEIIAFRTMTWQQAKSCGVSKTHFYRIRNGRIAA